MASPRTAGSLQALAGTSWPRAAESAYYPGNQ